MQINCGLLRTVKNCLAAVLPFLPMVFAQAMSVALSLWSLLRSAVAAQMSEVRAGKLLRFTFVIDIICYVYTCAAALDIGFAPGRVASFEGGLLAILILFLSGLGFLASIAPRLLVRTYLFALERYGGKGVLHVLLGTVTFSSAQPWRGGCSFFVIALGFLYVIISFAWRTVHPRALLGCGEAGEAGQQGGVLTSASPTGAQAPAAAALPIATPVAGTPVAGVVGGRPINPFLT